MQREIDSEHVYPPGVYPPGPELHQYRDPAFVVRAVAALASAERTPQHSEVLAPRLTTKQRLAVAILAIIAAALLAMAFQ